MFHGCWMYESLPQPIFTERDVFDVMQPILDLPVAVLECRYPRWLTHPTDIHNYAELVFGLFDLFPLLKPYRPGTSSYDQLYRHQHLVGVADAAL